jgi:hypothetical protein
MKSRMATHKRQRRLFAWMFLLATILLSSLVWIEILFPPPLLSPPQERSLLDLLEFDLPEPQLLAVVVALVLDMVSLTGLGFIALRDWLQGPGSGLPHRR